MLLSAVSVLVVAQSSSEIPEGLMNNPVLLITLFNELQINIFCGLLIGRHSKKNAASNIAATNE